MSVKNFTDEIGKGLPAPLYYLYADDQFLLKEAVLSAKASVPEEQRDFLFDSFDLAAAETSAPIEKILDVARTVPFFGGRRVVTIENVQKLKAEAIKKISAYMAAPSPDACLIMLADLSGKRGQKDPKKTLGEGLKGAKFISLNVRERELPVWIMERAAKIKLKLTGPAVDYLLGCIGPDIGVLSSEVDKLSLMGKDTLGPEDIREMVRGRGGYDVFDLTDALKRKDKEAVFGVYRVISGEAEPINVLGALNWQFERMGAGDEVFALLNEADIEVRRTGGVYPLELLFHKLLSL